MADASDVFEVRFHPGARDDMAKIVSYISHVGRRPLTALRFAEKIDDAVTMLALFPDAHAIAKGPPPRSAYWVPFKTNFLIFYEVFPHEHVVRVLYIWHGLRSDRPDFDRQGDSLPGGAP